ncbi:hypothetical protein [Halovenus sp. HT40]|uniref:hypothetical protein n=1 Tax=Halovenus sp. HT40 TaxID=3126691 RepID=UPI00300EA62B
MVSVRRLGGLFVVGFFVAMTALRPLLRNPAITNVGVEKILQWPQVLLYLPLLAVTGLLLVLAVLAVIRGDGLPTGSRDTPETRTEPAQTSEQSSEGFWEAERKKDSVWEEGDTAEDEQPEIPEAYQNHPAVSAELFEESDGSAGRIEDQTPDARLSEHLEHLKTELSEDETMQEDLDGLETVVEETEAGHEIPARCPQEGCDAVWSGRTMLGIKTDRYEVLDDGEEIVCLDCESVYRPEN